MEKLKQALVGSPYTTGVAAVAFIALAVHFKQLSAIDAVQFLLTVLLGAGAADAFKKGGSQNG